MEVTFCSFPSITYIMPTLEEILNNAYTSCDTLYEDLKAMTRDNGFTVQIGTGSNLNPNCGTVRSNFKCGSGGVFRSHHKQDNASNKTEHSNEEEEVRCKSGYNMSIVSYICNMTQTEDGEDDKRFYVTKHGIRKRKPIRSSKCIGCQWRVYASQSRGDGLWRAQLKNGSHKGHELASDPHYFHEYRHQDHEKITQVVEMSDNMLTPLQIMRQTCNDDGMPSFTLKDIYNIRQNMAQTAAWHKPQQEGKFLICMIS